MMMIVFKRVLPSTTFRSNFPLGITHYHNSQHYQKLFPHVNINHLGLLLKKYFHSYLLAYIQKIIIKCLHALLELLHILLISAKVCRDNICWYIN